MSVEKFFQCESRAILLVFWAQFMVLCGVPGAV